MPEGFDDFDVRDSNLRLGIEVEYPGMDRGDTLYVDRGRSTNDLSNEVTMPSSIGGRAVYDGTVGLEVVSDRLHTEDSVNWYRDVIEHVEEEYNTPYQPVGLMRRGSTAGMHIHLSPLSNSQARRLFEISQEPWAQVLFCSSIANTQETGSWPVFRGGSYCRMNYASSRYDCVNHRSGDHYEWRLPEPMAPEHMEIVVKFLRIFETSPEEAVRYAQAVLDSGDDRVTAIKRAEAVGMDIERVPQVGREPVADDGGFYQEVAERWDAPQIYRVSLDEDDYYAFESDFNGTFEVDGVEVGSDVVVHAETQTPLEGNEADEVLRAFTSRNSQQERETEATHELKKIIKKKKA